jgi:hypothetical protein
MPLFYWESCRWLLAAALLFAFIPGLCAQERWTEAQANAWYAAQPWPVGANFLPSTAINELEMWQGDTFDPTTIDRELGWAQGIGMNTMRVFLHNLLWEQAPKGFEQRVTQLEQFHRPLICTEYMARGAGSTFDTILPIARKHRVGAINWGLVAGKSQTYLPWDSWQHPYVNTEPTVWFHDVFHTDGKPYREREEEKMHKGWETADAHPGRKHAARKTLQVIDRMICSG